MNEDTEYLVTDNTDLSMEPLADQMLKSQAKDICTYVLMSRPTYTQPLRCLCNIHSVGAQITEKWTAGSRGDTSNMTETSTECPGVHLCHKLTMFG